MEGFAAAKVEFCLTGIGYAMPVNWVLHPFPRFQNAGTGLFAAFFIAQKIVFKKLFVSNKSTVLLLLPRRKVIPSVF